MKHLQAIVVISCVWWCGCGGSALGPRQGAEGGDCYPNGTCDEGLVCFSDLCVAEPACSPGQTEDCLCADSSAGQRVCDASYQWGECVCEAECGDGLCDSGETHASCPQDCPDLCENGVCDPGETPQSCPLDCPVDMCGNNTAEPGEDCDGDDLTGLTCADLGFSDGVLLCAAGCTLDVTGCTLCGDDTAEGVNPGDPGYEQCDGADLRSETCLSLGQPDGVLTCANCAYDLSGCTGDLPVTLEGTVWSPGADQLSTLQGNRFPIPNVLVAALSAPPAALPQSNACDVCPQVALTDPHTYSDAANGTFALDLTPGATYYLTIWSGSFRRVRQIQAPNTPGQSFTFEDPVATNPRPMETTLPNSTSLAQGDNIPRIAVIDASYEDQTSIWTNLGFSYGTEIDVIPNVDVQALVTSPVAMDQYQVFVAASGEHFPTTNTVLAADTIRDWVDDGGTLFADDFNYDFVEQPFPAFLTWHNDSGVCGDGTAPDPVNQCNNWSSYDFTGDAGSGAFASWIGLPEVLGAGSMVFENAWNYIYSLTAGEVGWDSVGGVPILQLPDVWLTNADTSPAGTGLPAMVSWPYYCGKVIYALPIIRTSASPTTALTLQEKIFINLIVSARGC